MSESQDADAPARRRAVSVTIVVVAAVLVVVVVVGVLRTRSSSSPKFCTLDGLVSDNGKQYHRDPNKDCQFVDQDGNPPPSG